MRLRLIVSALVSGWGSVTLASPPESTATDEVQSHLSESPPMGTTHMPCDLSDPKTHTFTQSKSGSRNRKQDWTVRYYNGLSIANTGTTMGYIGATTIVGGLTFWLIHDSIYSYGATIAALGALTTWAGAGVAQYGTSKSHGALIEGKVINKVCSGCIVSWAALTPYPITVIGGVPASYLISGAHRNRLALKYAAHRRDRSKTQTTIKLTPVATRLGLGLGMAGEF
jgi:hypothetical protein